MELPLNKAALPASMMFRSLADAVQVVVPYKRTHESPGVVAIPARDVARLSSCVAANEKSITCAPPVVRAPPFRLKLPETFVVDPSAFPAFNKPELAVS